MRTADRPVRRGCRAGILLGLVLILFACAAPDARGPAAGLAVDPGAAARMVSAYRAAQGRGPVAVDARLNAIASRQARAMAERGRLGHNLVGPLEKRLKSGGYVWSVAVENVGAGYDSFEDAFAAWRTSPGHRSNLLAPGVTQIGVGAASTRGDRYGTYWALVLAAPGAPRRLAGPGG